MDLENFNKFLKDLENFDNFLQDKWCWQIPAAVCNIPGGCNGRRHIRMRRRFNPLSDLEEMEFRLLYRFSKDNMRKIIEMIRDDLEMDCPADKCSNQVPVELQIMAAIRYWGSSENLEATATAHSVSSRTLAKICRHVASALAAKASRYIRMPATLAEKERVTSAFQALAGMPQVIGAVTHHVVQLKRKSSLGDWTEEHLHIQIVSDANLRICDHDCKIRSMREPNYEMFSQSRIKERFEQNEFRGRVLLGNDSLHCTSFLFTPVQAATSSEEQAFNRSHFITLAPAIKCLSLWTKRFGVLTSELCASYGLARQTIVALALLHNMAIEWNDPTFDCTVNEFANELYLMKSPTREPTSIVTNTDNSARHEFIKHNF